jgi:phosphoribosylglycinamide formyltransferase-1
MSDSFRSIQNSSGLPGGPEPGATRLVVLISGYGSNLQAILDACRSRELPARVVAVVSDKPDVYGLERARSAGIPALIQVKKREQDRRVYDSQLAGMVAAYQPDWIVLAGWMRILSSAFLDHFPDRVVNLHPALPGTFPGTHAIQRAFEAYQRGEIRETGVMVHLVPDEGVDNGPVLGQEIVPIYADDTLESLEAHIHSIEHALLIAILKRILNS